MNMYRILLLLLLISGTTACSLGGGPVPQDHYYRVAEIELELQQAAGFSNIMIKPVKASGLYHERAILYVEKDKPLELQRYHYNFWAETPANLIYDALYQGLVSSGIASTISRELTDTRPDFIIDSRIVRFERVIDGNEIHVEVELDITIRDGSDASRQQSRRYRSSVALETVDMHASAEAFGSALKAIATELVNELLVKK